MGRVVGILVLVLVIASSAFAQRQSLPEWLYELQKAFAVRQLGYSLNPSEYPTPHDTRAEVAYALCTSLKAAAGLPARGLGGTSFECTDAAMVGSVWLEHIDGVLGENGLASAFSQVERRHWEQCIDRLFHGNPAVIRRGDGFVRYCLPIVRRAARGRR